MEDACSSVQLTAGHFHQKLASYVQQGGCEWAGLSRGGGVKLRSDGSLNKELLRRRGAKKCFTLVQHLYVIYAPKNKKKKNIFT